MMTLQFKVKGQPVAKARPRARMVTPKGKKPFVSMYTPANTLGYEIIVNDCAKTAMDGREPTVRPVEVLLELRMEIPVSWPQKKRIAASAGIIVHTKKPDMDNLAKSLLDACNGVVWADDAQIVQLTVRKLYHAEPCALVAVREVAGELA